MSASPTRFVARRPLAVAAVLLLAAAARAATVDPATGVLTVGSAAPQNNNLKFEVGPVPGQVRVTDNLRGTSQTFVGITGITFVAGAGDDFLEFAIDASQSLALNLATGSGNADVKLQWKVPAGALSTASSLAMSSGGGNVQVELDFQSATRSSSFAWTTDFGGGNKILKSKFAFQPGTVNARKNVNFAQLGGGLHQVFMDVDSDASDARLTLNSGFAQDVFYKVVGDTPATRLDVNTTVRGARQGIEILSAAPTTNLSLRGGTANTSSAETTYSVVQVGGGTVSSLLDFVTQGFGSKFEAKYDGSASQLRLSGRLLGSQGNDQIKIESNMATLPALSLDCRGGTDEAQAPLPTALNCESFRPF